MAPGANVLVTGGAGFIGANVVRALLTRGYRVAVLDNLTSGSRDNLAGLDVDLIVGDMLDPQVVDAAVRGIAGVVHLAAQTGVAASVADPARDCQVNVTGTLNALEASRRSGAVTRFVFASSNAVLGRQAPPAAEDKAPLPLSPYGASKLAGEGYCLAYHGSWGLGTAALRFANVYGRYSGHKTSVVARFFSDIIESGCVTIEGGGTQTRDFIHAADLSRAVVQALERGPGGEVFQIGSGAQTSILELARLAQEAARRRVETRFAPSRTGDVLQSYSDIRKAREMLAWEPEIGLLEGLKDMWAWLCAARRGA